MSAPVPISCLPAGHSTVTLLLDAESLVLKLVTRCRPGTAAEAMLASVPPSTTKSATGVVARSASRLSGRCGKTGVRGCTWVGSLIDTRTPAQSIPPPPFALSPGQRDQGAAQGSTSAAADVFQRLNARR